MFGIILKKLKLIRLKHIYIDLEKRFQKNLVIIILLKIITKGIIFEKKITKFYCQRSYLHPNIEKESLNQKRAKEVLKEEKNNCYLI